MEKELLVSVPGGYTSYTIWLLERLLVSFKHIYLMVVYLVYNTIRHLNNWGLQLVTGTPQPHRGFHVVVNWIFHLSIATAPNISLPTSWVKKICPHGYERQSEMSSSLCHQPHPHPSNRQRGKSLTLLRISLSTLELDHSSSWPVN